MKNLKSAFFVICILLFMNSKAQDAQKKFGAILSKKAMLTEIGKSMPSLASCKLIFKTEEDAKLYFDFSENMKLKVTEELSKLVGETFVDTNSETFTTEDISAGKGNYAGGMTKLNGKLKPEITFYKIELLREKGATSGMAYKYWVFVNNKWVFLAKPYSAFKNEQK